MERFLPLSTMCFMVWVFPRPEMRVIFQATMGTGHVDRQFAGLELSGLSLPHWEPECRGDLSRRFA